MDKKILLLDTNKNMNNIFLDVLKENGYVVTLVYNFVQAFSSIKTNDSIYDLCILDTNLPDDLKENLNICQNLKENDISKNVPILLLACHNGLDDINLCLDAKVDIVLLKPFNIDYLFKRISLIFNDFQIMKYGKRGIDIALIESLIYLKDNRNDDKYLILFIKAFNLIIWNKMKSIIDYNQLKVMFNSTKGELRHKYSFINNFELSEDGLMIINIDSTVNKNDKLVNIFMYFIYCFINIVVLLSNKIEVDMNFLKLNGCSKLD